MLPRQTRRCFALDLTDRADLISAYKAAHGPGAVPAAVTQAIRSSDVSELEIWLCGNRMFMIMDIGPDFDPVANAERDANNPDVIAWEKEMWAYQQALPFAKPGEKWIAMDRIYSLAEQ